MMRMLVSHDLHTHQEELILEAEEQDIVRYIRKRWGYLFEIPIFEWFIPKHHMTKKYMIQKAISEGAV